MKGISGLLVGMMAMAVAMLLTANSAPLSAQSGGAQVAIDADDIGGVVSGPSGPEAGVWVIAETTDLPTKFARMVVTDDQGRYVVPDLPRANYKVWVRGYGLVDSVKVDITPGTTLNLTALPAPSAADAARYYPAIYWYSMLKIPDTNQFGGKSDIPDKVTQIDWLTTVKNRNCIGCHQLGQLATRTIPASLGEFKTGRRRGCGACSRDKLRRTWSTRWPVTSAAHRSSISVIGPTGSPRVSCRMPNLLDRKASSATSS